MARLGFGLREAIVEFDTKKAWSILTGEGLAAGDSKEDCYEKLGWLILFMKEYEENESTKV